MKEYNECKNYIGCGGYTDTDLELCELCKDDQEYIEQVDTMPIGWSAKRHPVDKIIVSHEDGSGIVLQENADSIAETLFYRMIDQILK